jgi:hypothetical protein
MSTNIVVINRGFRYPTFLDFVLFRKIELQYLQFCEDTNQQEPFPETLWKTKSNVRYKINFNLSEATPEYIPIEVIQENWNHNLKEYIVGVSPSIHHEKLVNNAYNSSALMSIVNSSVAEVMQIKF